MKALISGRRVVDVKEQEYRVHPSLVWVDSPDDIKIDDTYENDKFEKKPTPAVRIITADDIIRIFNRDYNAYIITILRQRNYAGEGDILSYASSAIRAYMQDAQAYITWKTECRLVLTPIFAGIRNNPSVIVRFDEVKDSLPVLTWPI